RRGSEVRSVPRTPLDDLADSGVVPPGGVLRWDTVGPARGRDRAVALPTIPQTEDPPHDVEFGGHWHHAMPLPVGSKPERWGTRGLTVLSLPSKSAPRPLGDQLALHLCEAAEQGKDEAAVWRRRVQ